MLIFIDHSKAFDTIEHTKLIRVIETIGIGVNLLKLFQNYLAERTYMIPIGDKMNVKMDIEVGVPQINFGTCTIFNICLNGKKYI